MWKWWNIAEVKPTTNTEEEKTMRMKNRSMETNGNDDIFYLCKNGEAEAIVQRYIEEGRPKGGASAVRFYELCEGLFNMNWNYKKYWIDKDRNSEGILTREDLFQSTMCLVLEKLEEYDQSKPFSYWFYGICNRACRKEFQYVKKQSSVLSLNEFVNYNDEDDCELIDILPSENSDFTNLSILISLSRERLGKLNVNYRNAFILKVIYGYDTKEIAQMLHVSVSTVNNWVHRGKDKLKKFNCAETPENDHENVQEEEKVL